MSITDDLAAIKADLASGPFCWLVQSHSGKNPPHGWSVRFTDPEQEDAVAVDLHRPDRIRRLVEHVEHERSHVYRLREFEREVVALLPGVYYMDPPDGGSVDPIEQLRRMSEDAARYRWLRGDSCPDRSVRWTQWEVRRWRAPYWTGDLRGSNLDAAIDAALEGKE